MGKKNRFREKRTYFVLVRGTLSQSLPTEGTYKAYCPKCDEAVICSVTIRACLRCGQKFCPPEQARTFK